MKPYSNFCRLNYSFVMALPIVRGTVYLIEIGLLCLGISRSFIASDRTTRLRSMFFQAVAKKYHRVYCTSARFARGLEVFKNNYLILDIPEVEKVSSMRATELYKLMWSLVFSKSVTKRTKAALRGFLPDNYPVI